MKEAFTTVYEKQYVRYLSEQYDEELGKLLQKSFDFESNRYKNIKEK